MFVEETSRGFDEKCFGALDRGAGDDGCFLLVAFHTKGDGGGLARDGFGKSRVLEGLIEIHGRREEIGLEFNFVSAFEVHAKVELHGRLETGKFDEEGGFILEKVDGWDGKVGKSMRMPLE